MSDSSARVDAWLWAVRVFKTRTAATEACRAGHVRVNGERAKPAQPVRAGDDVRVRIAGFDRMLVVRAPISKRVGAAAAQAAVEDRTPPRDPAPAVAQRDRGAGRPTKRDRRELDRWRGRGGGRSAGGRSSGGGDGGGVGGSVGGGRGGGRSVGGDGGGVGGGSSGGGGGGGVGGRGVGG